MPYYPGGAGAQVPTIIRAPRAANTILKLSDQGTWIDITAGTFAQTFNTAAALKANWYVWYRNAGTGQITLTPNVADTIDGLASYIMYPGEERLIQCDGVNSFTTMVISPFSVTLTASATFVTPPGYKRIDGRLWGAGGSGGNSGGAGVAGGAGGGACVPFSLTAAAMGASIAIALGAGGVAVAAGTVGNVGGNSTIGTLTTAFGGGGGGADPAGIAAFDGGSGGGALTAGAVGPATNVPVRGGRPSPSAIAATSLENAGLGGGGNIGTSGTFAGYGGGAGSGNQNGGNSVYGGGGGAGGGASARTGGTSVFGGAGGISGDAASGGDGVQPGGGGGGTRTGALSGAGGAGQCTLWGVA